MVSSDVVRSVQSLAGVFVCAILMSTPATALECSLGSLFGNECGDCFVGGSVCGGCADECGELLCEQNDCCVQFHGSFVQLYQGVVDGGNRERWSYGGSGRYEMLVDLGRAGVHDGLSLRVVTDHQVGEFVSSDAGVIIPPGLAAATPTPQTHSLVITNFLLTQVLNDTVSVFAGKMDTLDGDMNPLASGRGRTGFMNTSMLLPINGVPTVPFSTLAAGAIFSMDGNPFASIAVFNANDTTTTSGVSELFENGACILANMSLPFSLNDQLGLHTFSVAYSTKTFTRLGQDPRVILPNVPIVPHDGSWVAWWSGTQYIQQFDPKNNPLQGWGFFGRFGMSEDRVNPVTYWANFGIGGNNPMCSRRNDRWGIGWYYSSFSNELGPLATTLLNVGNETTGVELFYNWAVTENFYLTPDLQVISPGITTADTSTVLGIRGEIRI